MLAPPSPGCGLCPLSYPSFCRVSERLGRMERERSESEREREKERGAEPMPAMGRMRQSGSQELGSQLGRAHHCCLPGSALAGAAVRSWAGHGPQVPLWGMEEAQHQPPTPSSLPPTPPPAMAGVGVSGGCIGINSHLQSRALGVGRRDQGGATDRGSGQCLIGCLQPWDWCSSLGPGRPTHCTCAVQLGSPQPLSLPTWEPGRSQAVPSSAAVGRMRQSSRGRA